MVEMLRTAYPISASSAMSSSLATRGRRINGMLFAGSGAVTVVAIDLLMRNIVDSGCSLGDEIEGMGSGGQGLETASKPSTDRSVALEPLTGL